MHRKRGVTLISANLSCAWNCGTVNNPANNGMVRGTVAAWSGWAMPSRTSPRSRSSIPAIRRGLPLRTAITGLCTATGRISRAKPFFSGQVGVHLLADQEEIAHAPGFGLPQKRVGTAVLRLDLNPAFALKCGDDPLGRLAKSRGTEEGRRLYRTAAAAPPEHRQTQDQPCCKDD